MDKFKVINKILKSKLEVLMLSSDLEKAKLIKSALRNAAKNRPGNAVSLICKCLYIFETTIVKNIIREKTSGLIVIYIF